MDKEFEKDNVFGLGNENTAFAQYFIGRSYLNPLTPAGVSPFFANVTFEPGCRNNWHIHHATKGGGQILLCVAGSGWYQEWGKPASRSNPAMWCLFPQRSNIGTEPKKTAGFPISP